MDNLTPKQIACTFGASCPSVHRVNGRLLIVGEDGRNTATMNGIGWSIATESVVEIDPGLLETVIEEKTVSLRMRIKELEAEAERKRERYNLAAHRVSVLEEALTGPLDWMLYFEEHMLDEAIDPSLHGRFLADIKRASEALGTTPVSSAAE